MTDPLKSQTENPPFLQIGISSDPFAQIRERRSFLFFFSKKKKKKIELEDNTESGRAKKNLGVWKMGCTWEGEGQ